MQRESSSTTAVSNSSGLDKIDKPVSDCRRRQSNGSRKKLGSKIKPSLKQLEAQVSENNGSGDSIGLHELDRLVKQLEMLKNKIHDLFIRAQEMKPRD
jgi:hypothetical protein